MKEDLKRTLDHYRARAGEFRVVEVPPTRYLAVDGHGDPNTAPAYAEGVAAIYPAAYKLKFAAKQAGHDYVVMPLEALWWADDPASFTTARDKSRWQWTLLNLVPEWISDDLVEDTLERLRSAPDAPVALGSVHLRELREGTCVQTLHVGTYDDEASTLARMHDEVIPEAGLRMTGPHHEIYLNDARRTPPERLRTILRQPVTAATG